jgi:dipeptidyl aminopeptidase/acylaminoacyl peptidase
MGMPFTHAIRDERSYLLGGLTDVLAGVNEMVARRVADPDRLGILGFSYGGSMTAITITHTDRFKAAIYGEGAPSILEHLSEYPTKHFMGLFKDMWGLPTAFDPDDIKRMYDQSSLYRSQLVKTPVLLEAGERSAWKTDRQYFRSLRHFGVPSEFYVYPRSGHGWDEPKLMQDAYTRHIRWFDYWLLDKPYGDAEKQRAYDEWKKRRQAQSPSSR